MVLNWLVRKIFPTLPVAGLLLTVAAFVCPDELAYEQVFANEVTDFANHNRLSIARLNRDVHADCYIPVTVAAIVLADGTLKDVVIVDSSSVPVVDRYFHFVIEQAAPYPPLADYFDPVPDEVAITHEFRLDVRLWSDGISSTRPCEKLKPLSPPPG